MKRTHKLLNVCLVLGLASSCLAAEQAHASTAESLAVAPICQQVPKAVPLSAMEQQALQARATTSDPDLAQQRAGAFYEEPLFWGGVAAGVILLILL